MELNNIRVGEIYVPWLFMELYKCSWYIELHNSIMEQDKSVSIDLHIDLHKSNYWCPQINQVINTFYGHIFTERERSSQRQPCWICRKQRGNLSRRRQRHHNDDLSTSVHAMVHYGPNTTRHVRRPPLRSCLTTCEKATWRGERNMQDNIIRLKFLF